MNYWHELGAPKEKLILGVPFYGRSFTLTSPNQNKPGAVGKIVISLNSFFQNRDFLFLVNKITGSRSSGDGRPGQYTEEGGFMAYFEMCSALKAGQGWMAEKDAAGGTYAVNGDQWVGYDDVENIAAKVVLALVCKHCNVGRLEISIQFPCKNHYMLFFTYNFQA